MGLAKEIGIEGMGLSYITHPRPASAEASPTFRVHCDTGDQNDSRSLVRWMHETMPLRNSSKSDYGRDKEENENNEYRDSFVSALEAVMESVARDPFLA